MRGLQCLRVLAVLALLAGATALGCGSSDSNAGADSGGTSGSAGANGGDGGSGADGGGSDGQTDGTTGSDAAGGADGTAGSLDGGAADQSTSDQGASNGPNDAGLGPGCDGAVGTSWDAAAPVLIAKADYLGLQGLGVDRLGNAVVVWEQESNQQVYAIWASSRPAGGSWQAPTALRNEDHPAMGLDSNMIAIPPQLAVSDNGTGVAIWPMHFGLSPIQLYASHYASSQGWDGPVVISALPADGGVGPPGVRGVGNGQSGPQIAIDPNGNAIAVWSEGVQDVDAQATNYAPQIYARRYGAAGGWGAAALLSANGQAIPGTSQTTMDSETPHVAVDPAGDAVAVWSVSSTKSGGAEAVQAAHYDAATSTWGAPAFVDVCNGCSTAISGYQTTPRVAMDAQGNAIAIWNRFDGHGVWSSRFTKAGGWSAPQDISDSKNEQDADDSPRVAIDATGNAVATWFEGPFFHANHSKAGAWAAPVTLSSTASDSDVQPVFDSSGNALLVWSDTPAIDLVRFDGATTTFGAPQVIVTAMYAGYPVIASRGGACGGALVVFGATPVDAGVNGGIFAIEQR